MEVPQRLPSFPILFFCNVSAPEEVKPRRISGAWLRGHNLAEFIQSEAEKSLDASVRRSKTVNYDLAFAVLILVGCGLHLQCILQPRRQMNRRDHAARAATAKLNAREFKQDEPAVTAQSFALALGQCSIGATGKHQ